MAQIQSQIDAEKYLIETLVNSDPPRDPSSCNITAAAQEYYDTTGSWDLEQADEATVEQLLARHLK